MHIFDMDGTLIDSNGIWREVDEAFLAKRGFPYTKEYYQGVAHTIFPLAAEFTKRYCHLEESVEDIMAEWMEMAGDAYATRVQVKPGVREYLDQCRRRGQRMMVLTSSVPAHCRAALGHLGLMPYFEEILFAHDLKIEKKDPEIFRVAAQRMGVEPVECVVYDDSVEACRGAKAAGMHTVHRRLQMPTGSASDHRLIHPAPCCPSPRCTLPVPALSHRKPSQPPAYLPVPLNDNHIHDSPESSHHTPARSSNTYFKKSQ